MDPINLLSSGINAWSQHQANKTNARTAQRANELEWRIYQDQKQFSIDNRDYMNYYNSPEQQMKRLQAAGLNPYTATGIGSVGSASASAPSSPSVHTALHNAYRMDPINLVQTLSTLSNSIMDARVKAATAKRIDAETNLATQQYNQLDKTNPLALKVAQGQATASDYYAERERLTNRNIELTGDNMIRDGLSKDYANNYQQAAYKLMYDHLKLTNEQLQQSIDIAQDLLPLRRAQMVATVDGMVSRNQITAAQASVAKRIWTYTANNLGYETFRNSLDFTTLRDNQVVYRKSKRYEIYNQRNANRFNYNTGDFSRSLGLSRSMLGTLSEAINLLNPLGSIFHTLQK